MLWLAEDHCVAAQSAASRDAESRLDLYACLRGLQPGAHAKPDAQRNSDVVRPGRGVSERRSNASFGRSVARKITSQVLENSGRTQTNLEIARSARFFSGLLVPKLLFAFGQFRLSTVQFSNRRTYFPHFICIKRFRTCCGLGSKL